MSTRYFGIEIDSSLSWSCHIDFLFKSYSKKLGALKRMSHLPSRTLEEIYFKTVLPRITYCISVWGGCTTPLFNKLQEIHAKAAIYIQTIPSATDNFKVLKQANWHSLSYIYKKVTPETHSPCVLPNSSRTDPGPVYIERDKAQAQMKQEIWDGKTQQRNCKTLFKI